MIWQAVRTGFEYFQREAGYTRTGSHNTRVNGRETGQWHEADLIVAHWLQHTSRDGDMQPIVRRLPNRTRQPATHYPAGSAESAQDRRQRLGSNAGSPCRRYPQSSSPGVCPGVNALGCQRLADSSAAPVLFEYTSRSYDLCPGDG
jgi:hypothetical protein